MSSLLDISYNFSHDFIKYPLESQLSLGVDRRGCFEPPSETEPPTKGITCTDILPIDHADNITCEAAMDNPSQLLHPDCSSMQRYIMGTRLQTKGGTSKHKLPTCDFHDLDNCVEGIHFKTMSQGRCYSTMPVSYYFIDTLLPFTFRLL